MAYTKTNAPLGNAADPIEVSPEFKKQAWKAVLSIAAFVLVYLLLIALSLVLVAICVYAGFRVIVSMPKILTILIGVGLIGLGVMVFVFLVKFLFAKSEADHSDSIEITELDQPRLVAFIHQIAAETKTPLPKKIFLSPDVNACVFYNSSFWSMFLPVRKNLKVGLGLVNSLNVSEFKAVIAHEFGHFSQRSMKLGSYTYQVNRIIYNMLFQNQGFGESLNTWGNIHGVFAFFAQATVQIILGIQWMLRQMYTVVNKSYMSLSRQMEFHADLVAATVSGNNNIVSSLQKVEFSDACYNNTLSVCNQLLQEHKIVADIYEKHRIVSKHIADTYQVPFKNGMPILSDYQQQRPASRVNFKDQWASHPTLEERKAYVESFDLYQEPLEESAWSLFQDTAVLKQQLTRKLYENLPQDQERTVTDSDTFEALYTRQLTDFSLPESFKGYFDDRQVAIMEAEELTSALPSAVNFEMLLSDEIAAMPKKIQSLESDIAVLEAIERKEIDVKTFDFDGKKYNRKEAAAVKAILQQELEVQKQAVVEADKNLFRYFCQSARNSSPAKATQMQQALLTYFTHRKDADAYGRMLDELIGVVQPFYSGQTLAIENIHSILETFKGSHEPRLKEWLSTWTSLGAFEDQLKEKAGSFIAKDYQYFSGQGFMENELRELNELISESWNSVNKFLFHEFKSLLVQQVDNLPNKATEPAGHAKKNGPVTSGVSLS